MRLVCIDISVQNGNSASLTIGRVYNTLNHKVDWMHIGVKVSNDNNDIFYYNNNRFTTLELFRQEKIDRLLK